MRPGRPALITGEQRQELWRRYKAGETLMGIGRALGQGQTAIHRVLQATGGIAPAARRRSVRVLSFNEREEISRGIPAGNSFRAIAKTLNRAVSTVSQEVARHRGRSGYRAAQADSEAWEWARRPKACLLARDQNLQRIVAGKLKQVWSPQQIAGWLRDQHPGNPEMWVSHETIYRSLFVCVLLAEGQLCVRYTDDDSAHCRDSGSARCYWQHVARGFDQGSNIDESRGRLSQAPMAPVARCCNSAKSQTDTKDTQNTAMSLSAV